MFYHKLVKVSIKVSNDVDITLHVVLKRNHDKKFVLRSMNVRQRFIDSTYLVLYSIGFLHVNRKRIICTLCFFPKTCIWSLPL